MVPGLGKGTHTCITRLTNSTITAKIDRLYIIMRNMHTHTHRHMDIHTHVLQVHSPACMWECFSSVSAPAGSMDSLINTPFHMSAFMTSKFLSCTSHVFVRCMQSIFPQMPGKGAITGFAASQILTHENISVLLNRGFKEKYTLFLHFHHWNFMFMLIF